jgi:hypothetical protein
MAAIRQVVKRFELELDPQKKFKGIIPHFLLEDESTDERQQIQRTWCQFTESVNDACKTRRNIMVNNDLRKAVFDSGMRNLCRGFSGKHMNLKVEFINHDDENYKLELVRLSNVPKTALNCQGMTAEIPEQIYEVYAEPIGDEDETFQTHEAGGVRARTLRQNRPEAPTAQIVSSTTVETTQIISSTAVEPIQATPVEPDAECIPFAFQVLRIE